MLPESLDLDQVESWLDRVTIGGRAVECVTWDVTRPMSHIPGQSPTTSEETVDATLTPVLDPDVLEQAVTPWTTLGVWPPAAGTTAKIEVSADNGATWFPVFTGVTDVSKGTEAGDMTVDLVEKTYRGTRQVSWPPLQAIMPPYAEGGDWRVISLGHNALIDQALVAAGFYVQPAALPGTRIYANLMGTLWPRVGVLERGDPDSGNQWDSACTTEYGWGFKNFVARYSTGTAVTNLDLRVTVPVTQSDSVSSVTASSRIVYTLSGPSGTSALIIVNPYSRTAQLQVGGTVRATVTGLGMVLVVRRVSGVWQLCTDDGTPAVWTQTGTIPVVDTLTIDSGYNARAGGVCLADATGRPDLPSSAFTATAVIKSASHIAAMDAMPAILPKTTTSNELLNTLAAALWCHVGFDEYGRRWWYSTLGRLGLPLLDGTVLNQPPIVRTLSDDTDILGHVGWSQDFQARASQVVCQLKAPQMQRFNTPKCVWWKSDSSQPVTASEGPQVQFATPEDGTDWIMLDDTSTVATPGTAAGVRAAHSIGSAIVGFVDLPDEGSGPDDRPATTSEYTGSVARVDDDTVKITLRATGSKAVSSQTGTGTPWNWLPHSLQGGSGVTVRGYALTQWGDGSYSSPDTGSDAPVFTWDAGPYAGDHADYMVQWLVALLSNDRVDLDAITIVPDPRLQLGDRIALQLSTVGVTITGFITSKRLSMSSDGLVMVIGVMITAATVDRFTYAAFERAWSGRTYTALESGWSGKTYTDLQAAPLAHS